MAESRIRWTRSDYVTLGKAIANFNRKIKRLNAEERKLYLPEILDYKEEKANIQTRRQFNQFLNSIKRFSEDGAEELVILESGQALTKWEVTELERQSRQAKRQLNKQLNAIDKVAKPYVTSQERTLRAKIESINNWKSKSGAEFRRVKGRIQFLGSADMEMKKAIVFRENYMEEMKKYSNFQNYDKLIKKMESIKNPIDFYNTIKNNELIADLTYQSDEYYSQAQFDIFVQDWGVDVIENESDFYEWGYERREFYNKERKGEFEETL